MMRTPCGAFPWWLCCVIRLEDAAPGGSPRRRVGALRAERHTPHDLGAGGALRRINAGTAIQGQAAVLPNAAFGRRANDPGCLDDYGGEGCCFSRTTGLDVAACLFEVPGVEAEGQNRHCGHWGKEGGGQIPSTDVFILSPSGIISVEAF